MKKLSMLFTIVLLAGTTLHSQNEAFDKVFNKYALHDGFTTITISKHLTQTLGYPFSELKLGNIKILTEEDPAFNSQVNLYQELSSQLRLRDYRKLLHINKDTQVLIMRKKRWKGSPEFILVTSGDEDNTMIYIEGNITLYKLYKLSKAMESEEVSFLSSIH